MAQKIIGAQRDFSFGEVDVTLKRTDEHPARKGGLRQMSNMRILNSGAIQGRPGRAALFPATTAGRIEEVTMSPGNRFKIVFGVSGVYGSLQVVNSAGAAVANFTNQGNGAPLLWGAANLASIVYCQIALSIYITFPGMKPQVLSWNGVTTWTIADYAETISVGGQKRTPFYRLSPQGVTMLPSAVSGAITVQFSSPIVVAGMTGTRMRFAGRQILLGAVIDASNINATVVEPLPVAQTLTVSSTVGRFTIGDSVNGASSGATGIVANSSNTQYISALAAFPFYVGNPVVGGTSGATGVITAIDSPYSSGFSVSLNTATPFVAGETISVGASVRNISSASGTALVVQLLALGNTAPSFTAETIVGPSGTAVVSGVATASPQAITVWDEEVFNNFRGYPASCFADQFRLGFCNFPALPGGISWSAINSPTDLYVGPNPVDAIFEIAPDKVQVYYVVPGAESSEFVFCDGKLYYIKIDATNPLKPGSVGFQVLSSDGCAQVQPRTSQEIILYVNAGRSNVMAIVAAGAYYRPFNTRNLCEFHNHLFSNIQAIAVPTADGSFDERYAYVLNGDGSLVVGKYTLQDGQIVPTIGWGPWSSVGAVQWVATNAAEVIFTTSYFGVTICEVLDDAKYLDAGLFVNALPAAFAAPVGKGPLWWIPSQTVSLMDQSTRSMGIYDIDVDGFIVPQGNAGEDLSAASLLAGQLWTATVEPFCPNAQPGADAGQRMKMRQISYFAAYVVHSTGFMLGHLFSGRITPTGPALGTLMNFRRFPAWNQGDDATLPPPDRETVEEYPPQGSSYDPRPVLIKDTPGPLQLLEFAIEVSI